MKKSVFRFASLFLSAALTAAFGFLTYFIIAGALEKNTDISVPLPPENDDAAQPEADAGDSSIPDAETDGSGGTAPDGAPDALPPDTENGDTESSGDGIVDEDEEKKRGSKYVRSKTGGLNVRRGPGTNYVSLGSLDKNDMLTYSGKSGNWYITEFRGRTAYVSADSAYTEIYSIDHEIDETIEKVIAEGYKLLGHPYVYGAVRLHDGKGNFLRNFDSSEYDCSSLMQYIYFYGADVILDVTTRTQVKQGRHVPRSDLKRGDLMFFTNSARYNKTGVERIGHVALYLGDNYILHTATDHAVIEPISAQRWNYYIESRRVA